MVAKRPKAPPAVSKRLSVAKHSHPGDGSAPEERNMAIGTPNNNANSSRFRVFLRRGPGRTYQAGRFPPPQQRTWSNLLPDVRKSARRALAASGVYYGATVFSLAPHAGDLPRSVYISPAPSKHGAASACSPSERRVKCQ